MDGLVVVQYAKQLHLITPKARSKWLLRGVGKELSQSPRQGGFILTLGLFRTLASIIP